MTKISLTTLGITFLSVSFIFTAFLYAFALASSNGFDTSGLDNTTFTELGDQEKVEAYINETKTIQDDTIAEKGAFDIIGNLIATALSPVRTLIGGANFLISNLGKMLGYLGVPTIVNDFVTGLLSFIVASIFLFAVVLGRRDKID